MYHRDAAHRGVGPTAPVVDALQQQWAADLDGEVYAEPLLVGDILVAVTENDTVYALDVDTGAVRWGQHIGEPVPLADLPCGNIDPSGLTSTPVIDVGERVLYVAGRFQPAHHELVALDLGTGATRFRQDIDPPGADARALQQRGALALANGTVYIPFGGNAGDCGSYHGWVVGVSAGGSGDVLFYRVPTQSRGAIWAPSGISVDGDGTLMLTTGDGEASDDFDYENAVIRLSADLVPLDFWTPPDWRLLDRLDLDVGSIGPSLLQDDQLFQSGKNGVGYLLRSSNLGGIDGQFFSAPICGGAYGGTAYQPPVLYVPCEDGLVALRVANDRFDQLWHSERLTLGPPILAYGWVWSTSAATSELWQMDPESGAVQQRYGMGGPIEAHFITPTAGDGMLFAPAGQGVLAWSPAAAASTASALTPQSPPELAPTPTVPAQSGIGGHDVSISVRSASCLAWGNRSDRVRGRSPRCWPASDSAGEWPANC